MVGHNRYFESGLYSVVKYKVWTVFPKISNDSKSSFLENLRIQNILSTFDGSVDKPISIHEFSEAHRPSEIFRSFSITTISQSHRAGG